LTMLDGEVLVPSLSIEEIARRVAALAGRVHRTSEDFSVDLFNMGAVQRLLVDNPIAAFVDAKGMGGVPYFKFDGKTSSFAFETSEPGDFRALCRELRD